MKKILIGNDDAKASEKELRIMMKNKIFIVLFALVQFICTAQFASLTLTRRQLCDLELISNGGFAPLKSFMNRADYDAVVDSMRLTDGTIWPIPVVLDIPELLAKDLHIGDIVELKTVDHLVIARLTVSEIWKPDKILEVQYVYGTDNSQHYGVDYILNKTHDYYVSGSLEMVNAVPHYDFIEFRRTPEQLKDYFRQKGFKTVVGFQTRNPMHRAHVELTVRASKLYKAHLLIHPSVGMTKSDDVDHFTRVKCYKKILNHYSPAATLSLLPLAMRMAGPREALWHAIIRKNYGCTHFIIGRDHAGPGKDNNGNDFYGPYEAQNLALQYEQEIGIKIVPFVEMVYAEQENRYKPVAEIVPGEKILTLCGTHLRALLRQGKPIPTWFTYPDIEQELRKTFKPSSEKGLCILFTGLSGSGKSTLAYALAARLQELQYRTVTVLDNDQTRKFLFPELGFTSEDRSKNVARHAFIAEKIAKSGGIVLCSLIAPYDKDRAYFKKLLGDSFLQVYMSTSLQVCQDRDPKQLYAQANAGQLPLFTGIHDVYQPPLNSDLVIDAGVVSVDQALQVITDFLTASGWINASK